MDRKKNILVVDDSEFVRSYHSYILEQADFRTITAMDGSDALEKLYANPFDLILTDVNMSTMDGYEFIRRVRAHGDYNSLPIVIVSTESEARDKRKGFEAGANLYIVKPTTPEAMIESIRLLLASGGG